MQFGPATRRRLLATKSASQAPRFFELRIVAIADHGCIDGGGLDPDVLGIGEHAGNRCRRHDHQRMLDRLRQRAQRRKARLAEDPGLPRIDENNAAAIAELAQVLEDFARPARALGCTDQRQRLGLQRTRG